MTTAEMFTPPVRADLATVAPTYYPIVERARFGSVAAMCKRYGWPLDEIRRYVDAAMVEGSVSVGQEFGLVVIEALALGDPEHNMRAVLILQPGGAVVLCAGLFAEMTEDLAEVEAMLAEFGSDPEFKRRLLAVGEFRANPSRAAS